MPFKVFLPSSIGAAMLLAISLSGADANTTTILSKADCEKAITETIQARE